VNDLEQQLQAGLESTEAGEPLEKILEGMPENEAELLKLAASLRQLEFPPQDHTSVSAQHNRLIQKAEKEKIMSKPSQTRLLRWLLPAAAGIFILVCLAAGVVAAGIGWFASRNAGVAENPTTVSTGELVLAQTPTPKLRPRETATAVPNEPEHDSIVSVVSLPEYDNPHGANLRDIQGLVEIQDHDGTWLAVNAGHVVAGKRVRTGPLSSVALQLFDGSRIVVGPDTEISIEKLNAPTDGSPRKVFLTQWIGETEHDTVPSDNPKSRYEVTTPSALGTAQGTTFKVVVLPNLSSRFIVMDGSVAVTGLNVMVTVVAGQVTTVNAGEPPGEPVFRITGEGEVTSTGDTWTIAGQTFQTHDNTIVVGNPQVGDLVHVDGRLLPDDSRIADQIVLLRRAVSNRFSLSGEVEAIGSTWTVAGQIILVNDETIIDEDIAVGDNVQVKGIILLGGTLQAQVITRLEEAPGLPFQFSGIVQAVNEGNWIISGQSVAIDEETIIDDGYLFGTEVVVRGWILENDTWLAGEIRRQVEDLPTFEFTGIVQSVDPWQAGGIGFETRPWTVITPGVNPGDLVRVHGSILVDGVWVADTITSLVGVPITITFIGVVANTNPWVVGGLLLAVTDDTVIPGNITIGSPVVVQVQLLPDGTWTVLRFLPLYPNFGFGCLQLSTPVISVNADTFQVKHWHIDIKRDGRIKIHGKIKQNSIITLPICTGWDGFTIIVGDITVIHQAIIVIIDDGGETSPPPNCKITSKGTIKCSKKNNK